MRALLLAGGGARGILTVAALQAYQEQYKTYDALFGTSVGALCGALYHQGDHELLKTIFQNISNGQVYYWNPLKMFGPGAALASSAPLEKLINKYISIEKLAKNPAKFYVSITQTNPLQPVTVRLPYGPNTSKYILASASAPIAFPTQTIDGRQFTDGGISRNFGIQNAIDMGYDEIILIWPSQINQKPIKNLLDMLEFQMTAQGAVQFLDESNLVKILDRSKQTVSLTVYHPDEGAELPGMLDFTKVGRLYEQYFNIGYNMLKKPQVQYRRTLQAGKPRWMVYH